MTYNKDNTGFNPDKDDSFYPNFYQRSEKRAKEMLNEKSSKITFLDTVRDMICGTDSF